MQTVTFGSALTAGHHGHFFKLGFNSQTTANITVGTAIRPTGTAANSGASESGTTVTIRAGTSASNSLVTGLKVGAQVTISGVGVAGYNASR